MEEKDARFSLRLPRDIMKQVRHEAAEWEMSINSAFAEIISEWLESRRDRLPISEGKRQQRRIA
jgi:Leu/Phe-tRNA-protein transferase